MNRLFALTPAAMVLALLAPAQTKVAEAQIATPSFAEVRIKVIQPNGIAVYAVLDASLKLDMAVTPPRLACVMPANQIVVLDSFSCETEPCNRTWLSNSENIGPVAVFKNGLIQLKDLDYTAALDEVTKKTRITLLFPLIAHDLLIFMYQSKMP